MNGHGIRKAVIPAAGLGTRLLPATKASPKEMLPVAGKPLIQHAVEEAAASGIEVAILVIRNDKSALVEHFKRDLELESFLESQGKIKDAELVREISNLIEIRYVVQEQPRGLANAIACARQAVGAEPFAVLLPDVIIDAPEPCTQQLMRAYDEQPGCIIAVREVSAAEAHRYGIVTLEPSANGNSRNRRILALIEKPSGVTNCRPGIFGRYVLAPEVFAYIENTPPDRRGETQLTDVLNRMCGEKKIYGFYFEGRPYDAGDAFGLLKANVDFALKDPALQDRVDRFLSHLQLQLSGTNATQPALPR